MQKYFKTVENRKNEKIKKPKNSEENKNANNSPEEKTTDRYLAVLKDIILANPNTVQERLSLLKGCVLEMEKIDNKKSAERFPAIKSEEDKNEYIKVAEKKEKKVDKMNTEKEKNQGRHEKDIGEDNCMLEYKQVSDGSISPYKSKSDNEDDPVSEFLVIIVGRGVAEKCKHGYKIKMTDLCPFDGTILTYTLENATRIKEVMKFVNQDVEKFLNYQIFRGVI